MDSSMTSGTVWLAWASFDRKLLMKLKINNWWQLMDSSTACKMCKWQAVTYFYIFSICSRHFDKLTSCDCWHTELLWKFELLKRCDNLTCWKDVEIWRTNKLTCSITGSYSVLSFFCKLTGVNKCLNILFWSNPALAVPTDKMRICFRDRFWYSWPYCYQWIHKLLQINRTKNGNSNKFKLVGEFSLKQYFYFGVYMMILYL